MIARENLRALLLARPRVFDLDDLGVVLQDVGQARWREHRLPEVVGLQAVGVRWVAGTIVVADVEWQEPRGLAFQLSAHAHLGVVHGEVHHTAAELEQPLARVAVAPVLLDRVLDGLLGQAVLQLEGCDRQAVDKQAQVQRAPAFVGAVGQLARDREAVLRMQCRCLGIALGRRAVEQVEVAGGMVLNALAQHVDDATLADLSRKPAQELEAVQILGVMGIDHRQLLEGFRLRGA